MINLPSIKLKEILCEEGIVSALVFDEIEREAKLKQQNITDLLIARSLVTKDYLLAIFARSLGLTRVNLSTFKINEQVLHMLPENIARQRKVILFERGENSAFQVAMEDPTDLETINFLSVRFGAHIEAFLASDEDLDRGFSLYERKLTQDFKKIIEESIQASLRSKALGDLEKAAVDLPIVEVVDNLLAYALSSRASDLHFEVLSDGVLVRERVDGILHEVTRIPREVHSAIVARMKILGNLHIDEHGRPQDGRFRHTIQSQVVDVRVSVIPTFYGEKVELRLFSGTEKPLSLEELGFFEDHAKFIRAALKKTYGMVLVCGPTGSGKTTTLYSCMNILNRPEVNMVTIEDPIEYNMRYVNQVQVNVTAGITFADGLRSILRQDPNIIMVGEIRDEETATIAVQAALTGHLVLSSLHTNDAPTVIPRLIDMGVPPFLVSAVLNDIIAQRLVRKIHVACIESYPSDENTTKIIMHQLQELGIDPKTVAFPRTLYRGKGCAACNDTGYLGRVGIYEVVDVTEAVRKVIISEDFSLSKLRTVARNEGMLTMFEDGLRKVERGITTVEEVFRVIRE